MSNHEVINSEIHSAFDYLYRSYADAREDAMRKYGNVSEVDSENLMYATIRDVLSKTDDFDTDAYFLSKTKTSIAFTIRFRIIIAVLVWSE